MREASGAKSMSGVREIDKLPNWSDCEAAVDDKTATALQHFIYEYEPGDSEDAKRWRERLRALVNESIRSVNRK